LVLSFFVAMQSRRAVASYWHPQSIVSECNEFLIVSRSGERNEFLHVSNAGASSGSETKAPTGLRPEFVLVATLVSQGLHGGEIFLVERTCPRAVRVEGRHIGGDGYFLLTEEGGTLSLRGSARIRADGRTSRLLDRCVLFAANEPGAVVHVDARHIPWVREVLPVGGRPGPRLIDGRTP
jgi:hypothetical protein